MNISKSGNYLNQTGTANLTAVTAKLNAEKAKTKGEERLYSDSVELLALAEPEKENLLGTLTTLSERYGLYGLAPEVNYKNVLGLQVPIGLKHVMKKLTPEQALYRLELANNIKNRKLESYLQSVNEKVDRLTYPGEEVAYGRQDKNGKYDVIDVTHFNDSTIEHKGAMVFIDRKNGSDTNDLYWDPGSKTIVDRNGTFEPVYNLDTLRENKYNYTNDSFPAYTNKYTEYPSKATK